MKYPPSYYIQALAKALGEKSEQERARILERVKEVLRVNGDERLLPVVLRAALQRVRYEKNQRTMRIVSAIKLSEKEGQMIKNSFPAETHKFEVNEGLFGGLVLQKGTKLYRYTFVHAIKNFANRS